MSDITNNELARMVQEGFAHIDDRFKMIDERFESVDDQLSRVDRRFDIVDERFKDLEAKVDSVQMTLLHHMDAEATHRGQLEHRITVIEKQLGITTDKIPA